jgi:FlaA1/EpsC-like NDP-sugar epimerase
MCEMGRGNGTFVVVIIIIIVVDFLARQRHKTIYIYILSLSFSHSLFFIYTTYTQEWANVRHNIKIYIILYIPCCRIFSLFFSSNFYFSILVLSFLLAMLTHPRLFSFKRVSEWATHRELSEKRKRNLLVGGGGYASERVSEWVREKFVAATEHREELYT